MARKLSKKKISLWLLLFAVIIFFSCGGPRMVSNVMKSMNNKKSVKHVVRDISVDRSLVQRLDSFVANTRRAGTLGVYVWDATAGKEVYAFKADSLMRPASNMKMLTCIAALRILGPNFKYRSGVYTSGKLVGDTLRGNIAFKFNYDPWFTPDSLMRMTDVLRAKGIKAVKGNIIVDIKIQDPMQHEQHWTPGDLKTRKLGILYRGKRRVLSELKYALRAKGVNFKESQLVESQLPKGMKKIGEITTPITDPIMRALLNSSNENAECLSYTMSGNFPQGQDFRVTGNDALKRFVKREMKINPDKVAVIHDGSGLCVHDRITPRFLVSLLRYAYSHKYINNVLLTYLPVSGEVGTLHRRMWRPELKGRIQAKTGTLTREDGITSLSGYVKGNNGHQLLFAIIQNEVPVADARLWQDRFCSEFVK